MEKTTFKFEDFLIEVDAQNQPFASKIHELLSADGYKHKIESKAAGMFISYSHPKTKKSILNFLFRKKSLVVRMYIDNIAGYAEFFDRMPESMEKEVAKASVCKRLINPEDCNSKCAMGYDFSVRGNHYQKCRYSCFQFAVNADSIPYLTEFIEKERSERAAA